MSPELRFEFTTDAAPVQIEGSVDGRPFYFRARHDSWSFAVAERSGVDPAVLDAVSAPGQGWYVEGAVQERGAASFLSRTDAVALVRDAAAAYLRARAG